MRCLAILSLLALGACAGNQYSDVPEPTGEWVPVNPPGFAVVDPAPAPLPYRRPVLHRVRHAAVRHPAVMPQAQAAAAP